MSEPNARQYSMTEDGKRTSRPRYILVAAMLLILMLATGLFSLFGAFDNDAYVYTENTKILVYHLVSDDVYGDNAYLFVKPADLEQQLIALRERGYKSVFADELSKVKNEKCVVLTFDDGYADNFDTLLPLLQKYEMKATVFLISEMIGADGHLSENEIRTMAESGYVHFGSHTKTHRRLSDLDSDAKNEELTESKARIEALTGRTVTALAYPNGIYDRNTELAAAQAGYRYCFTTDAPRESFYENTRLPRSYVVRDMPMDDFLKILE